MNRRLFLQSFAAVPVVLATPAIVEALAPKRSIFLPPRGGWPTDGLQAMLGSSDFEISSGYSVPLPGFPQPGFMANGWISPYEGKSVAGAAEEYRAGHMRWLEELMSP